METGNWPELLGLLGIGSLLTIAVQYMLKQKETTNESRRKDLEARYKVVILLIYAAYDYEGNRTVLRINRPDLKSKQLVIDELKAEWFNMLLFASAETLSALQGFIQKPNIENLQRAALAMRHDLGRGKVKVDPEVFRVKDL